MHQVAALITTSLLAAAGDHDADLLLVFLNLVSTTSPSSGNEDAAVINKAQCVPRSLGLEQFRRLLETMPMSNIPSRMAQRQR